MSIDEEMSIAASIELEQGIADNPTPDNKPYPTGVPVDKIKEAIRAPFGTPTPDPIAFNQAIDIHTDFNSDDKVSMNILDIKPTFKEVVELILDEPLTEENVEEIAGDLTEYVSTKITAAHNQSLQTAVTQARLDAFKEVLATCKDNDEVDRKWSRGDFIKFLKYELDWNDRSSKPWNDPFPDQLTKAKEVNNV